MRELKPKGMSYILFSRSLSLKTINMIVDVTQSFSFEIEN